MAEQAKPDNLLPATIGAALLAFVLWTAFGGTVRETAWSAMRAQAVLVQYVIPLYPPSYRSDFARFVRILKHPVPPDLPAATLLEAVSLSGKFLALPSAIGLIGFAFWIWRRSPAVRYRRTMDFERLLQHQARVFPRVRPVLWLKNKTKREDRGNYWWPLAPYEWALLVGALQARPDPADTRDTWTPSAASRAFAAQLGRASADARPFHEDLLIGIFGAMILGEKRTAHALMDAASAGFGPAWSPLTRARRFLTGATHSEWPAKGPWEIRLDRKAERDLEGILSRFRKGEEEMRASPRVAGRPLTPEGALAATFHRSHHIRCSIARLLEGAQAMGIITTSDFIWLKAVDRCLHYTLNDVGRRVASIESSGVRAHLQAENSAGKALVCPAVEEAVSALDLHLNETGWAPPPALDHASYLQASAGSAEKLASLDDEIQAAKGPLPVMPADMSGTA